MMESVNLLIGIVVTIRFNQRLARNLLRTILYIDRALWYMPSSVYGVLGGDWQILSTINLFMASANSSADFGFTKI